MNETVFHWLAWAWLGLAIVLFPLMLRVTAPYGRHTKQLGRAMIDNRLGWFLMELPALLLVAGLVIHSGSWQEPAVALFMALWTAHYFYRAILFPSMIRTPGKKMPVMILISAFAFNMVNGSLNGYWLGWLEKGTPNPFSNPRILIGLALFAAGFLIHLFHDRLLIGLRKDGGVEYHIPQVGLFKLISCPNFLGEMIEWAGFALMTWNPASLSFLVWTIANLSSRAADHHRWYQGKFSSYPTNRRALVPWIW